ncbi:MAG: ADP-ribosylglycohydrolase family protein, partial [Clostridia bacterium]|nr:ADP-ribosylglycohydrolase family protein [Clostridia bacterium]
MELIDRIRGSLLGGAAGDALGYAVEFITAEMIQDHFGAGGIRHYALSDGKALISDDTQMTLFTAEGIIMGWNRAVAGGMAADMEVYV